MTIYRIKAWRYQNHVWGKLVGNGHDHRPGEKKTGRNVNKIMYFWWRQIHCLKNTNSTEKLGEEWGQILSCWLNGSLPSNSPCWVTSFWGRQILKSCCISLNVIVAVRSVTSTMLGYKYYYICCSKNTFNIQYTTTRGLCTKTKQRTFADRSCSVPARESGAEPDLLEE